MWPSTEPAAGSEAHPQENDEPSCDVGSGCCRMSRRGGVGDTSTLMLRSRQPAAARSIASHWRHLARVERARSAYRADRFCRSLLTGCGHELPRVASGGALPAAWRRCRVWGVSSDALGEELDEKPAWAVCRRGGWRLVAT